MNRFKSCFAVLRHRRRQQPRTPALASGSLPMKTKDKHMSTTPTRTPLTGEDAGTGARDPRKAAMSGWIGSALEYYDFALYSLAATLIFPAIFFPSENPTVGIIASLEPMRWDTSPAR